MTIKKPIKYSLAPQTKFYDSMGSNWKPFLMFNHFPNIRSKYCNTDKDGLRFNNFNNASNISNSIFNEEKSESKKTAILLGGSYAFSEGSTSDANTISSYLTKKTNYNFLNLAGRGFSGYQEIIIFMSNLNKIKNIKKIVILSGLNDLLLSRYIKNYDETYGPIFGNNIFTEKMKETTSWKNKVFKFVFGKFFNPEKDWSKINSLNWKKEIFSKKIEKKNALSVDSKLENTFERNFMIWSTIAKGMNLNIDYVLQPSSIWQEKILSSEEEKIFNESDKMPDIQKIYESINLDKYVYLKEKLQNITKKYDINFIDSNEILKKKCFKDWMYVDKVHMNDTGYERVANELITNLSLTDK